MPPSIYDFKAINKGLKALGGEQWIQPTQHLPTPQPEPAKPAEPALPEAAYDPFGDRGYMGY